MEQEIWFLPQKPYCTLGTLKDQLLYPTPAYKRGDECEAADAATSRSPPLRRDTTDDDLLRVMVQVDLIGVASRVGEGDPKNGLDTQIDWAHTLSAGEQQRLGFARLLVHHPRLAVLDEATWALDIASERNMYTLLRKSSQNSRRQATYISVGHRPSLLAYHRLRLHLGGVSGSRVHKIGSGTAFEYP